MASDEDPTSRLKRAGSLAKLGGSLYASYAKSLAKQVVMSPEERKTERARAHRNAAEEIFQTLGQLRGAMVKIGQLLSTTDVLPDEQIEILTRLHARVPPMHESLIRRQLANELGAPPEERYSTLDPAPLASASLGQVYRATLFDGTPVAVKVQYPGVASAIEEDLKLFLSTAKALGLASSRYDATELLVEIREALREELDYEIEAASIARFREYYAGDPDVSVPQVYSELSTKRVLTMQLMYGRRIDDFLASAPPEQVRIRLSACLYPMLWTQAIRLRSFHADPNPANFLVHDDGSLALVDFGCVRSVGAEDALGLRDFLRALLAGDEAGYRAYFHRHAAEAAGAEEIFVELARAWSEPLAHDRPFIFGREYHRRVIALYTRWVKEAGARVPRQLLYVSRVGLGVQHLLARINVPVNYHRPIAALTSM